MTLCALTDAEQVAVKCLVACFLESTLLVTTCICMLLKIPVESALFIEAATFVCAVAGVSYVSFRTQRMTDWEYVSRKGDADAKVATAEKPS